MILDVSFKMSRHVFESKKLQSKYCTCNFRSFFFKILLCLEIVEIGQTKDLQAKKGERGWERKREGERNRKNGERGRMKVWEGERGREYSW